MVSTAPSQNPVVSGFSRIDEDHSVTRSFDAARVPIVMR
jgi:hypothetical protein